MVSQKPIDATYNEKIVLELMPHMQDLSDRTLVIHCCYGLRNNQEAAKRLLIGRYPIIEPVFPFMVGRILERDSSKKQ